jgi:AcrR family transcriptional regulator
MAVRLPAAVRRDQLLGVALTAFATEGFHLTSMNDIAERAGVTKPVLYQHFTSKRHLYRELLAEEGQRLLEAVSAAARTAQSPRDQVARGMAAYFHWVAEDHDAFNLMFGSGARRDSEFAADVRSVETAMAAAISDLISADVSDAQRRLVAAALISMAEGTSRLLIHEGVPFDPDTLAHQLADFAWSGLRGLRRLS